jgi:toxin ParE1/3/4
VAKLRFSSRAEGDLCDITVYTLRTWGDTQTDRYICELEDCCHLLADSPALGRPCNGIRPGLRRMEHGKHVVFYREEDGGMLPQIQAIDDEDDAPG